MVSHKMYFIVDAKLFVVDFDRGDERQLLDVSQVQHEDTTWREDPGCGVKGVVGDSVILVLGRSLLAVKVGGVVSIVLDDLKDLRKGEGNIPMCTAFHIHRDQALVLCYRSKSTPSDYHFLKIEADDSGAAFLASRRKIDVGLALGKKDNAIACHRQPNDSAVIFFGTKQNSVTFGLLCTKTLQMADFLNIDFGDAGNEVVNKIANCALEVNRVFYMVFSFSHMIPADRDAETTQQRMRIVTVYRKRFHLFDVPLLSSPVALADIRFPVACCKGRSVHVLVARYSMSVHLGGLSKSLWLMKLRLT